MVSVGTADCVGGLASYMRFLGGELAREHSISAVGRFHTGGPPRVDYAAYEQPRTIEHAHYNTRIIAPRPGYVPLLRQLPRFTSRPLLHRAAVTIFNRAYRDSMREAIPEAVDVVHYVTTGFELLGFSALEQARQRGAIFTVLPAAHPGTWGDSPLDIRLYNQSDAVFVLSESERDHLIAKGTNPSLLKVTGLAPASAEGTVEDAESFRSRHQLGNRPLILFIGRKTPDKGYHTLRRAMAEISQAIPDACLVVIGPDRLPPYPPVDPSAILDLDKASEQEKVAALAACDVFCLPSTDESFGIAYVEAWMHGKPVIGGPAPAVQELIRQGVTGICVPQDPGEVAGAVIKLLSDAPTRKRMGEAGRQLQQSQYTWKAVAQRHVEVFMEAIQKAKGSTPPP